MPENSAKIDRTLSVLEQILENQKETLKNTKEVSIDFLEKSMEVVSNVSKSISVIVENIFSHSLEDSLETEVLAPVPVEENIEKIEEPVAEEIKEEEQTDKEKLYSFATLLAGKKESENESEKVIGLIAGYVLQADISGKEDGHIHSKKELIETALLKTDKDLLFKFSQKKEFQNELLEHPEIESLADMFVKIHMEIAHGDDSHEHNDDNHEHVEKVSETYTLNGILKMPDFQEQASEIQFLANNLLSLKTSEKKSEQISGIFAEYITKKADFSPHGEFHSHNSEELVEECLTVYDRENGTELLDEYLVDEDLQKEVLENENIQKIGKIFLDIHTNLPH